MTFTGDFLNGKKNGIIITEVKDGTLFKHEWKNDIVVKVYGLAKP